MQLRDIRIWHEGILSWSILKYITHSLPSVVDISKNLSQGVSMDKRVAQYFWGIIFQGSVAVELKQLLNYWLLGVLIEHIFDLKYKQNTKKKKKKNL